MCWLRGDTLRFLFDFFTKVQFKEKIYNFSKYSFDKWTQFYNKVWKINEIKNCINGKEMIEDFIELICQKCHEEREGIVFVCCIVWNSITLQLYEIKKT